MADTFKVYTSHPTHKEYPRYDYDPPPAGPLFWFLFIVAVIVAVIIMLQRMLEWWDNLGMPYGASSSGKYYDYNTNTTKKTNILTGVNDRYDNEVKAKPQAKKWVNNLYKPKPIIPPRMFFTGRLDGQPVEWTGPPETKYLLQHERNRYYTQKGVSIAEQDDIEAKWEKDLYNGT